ncbi:Odorant Hypothetical protein protein [Nesidiocoris tenuis]|uniref:Uncharacterized protein n=1 Tax=Nesidiocoris tenuis TaxID=355587 RepID=A0ABN7AN36_9HEMI|nr:Odorant Hypothetical protein protein [Nesidiocoris tenuis]
MKIHVCVLLGLICLLDVEGVQRQTKQQKNKPQTKENQGPLKANDPKAAACISQTQASEDEVASFLRKEIPETDNGKCLLACYLDAKGVMSNGKFNSAGAQKIAARAYPNNVAKTGQVRHVLTHCGTVASRETEKCQLAYKLADCTTTLSDKFKLY